MTQLPSQLLYVGNENKLK
uniref:Uncharacterized protein n=1 Tax=Anguilla anguilla TaxID=7936 RepID=A0A0E9PAN0_ANGAN